jgi:hypothetical protein
MIDLSVPTDKLFEKIQPGKLLRKRCAFGVPMMCHAARDVAKFLFHPIDNKPASAMNADIVCFDFLQGGQSEAPG